MTRGYLAISGSPGMDVVKVSAGFEG